MKNLYRFMRLKDLIESDININLTLTFTQEMDLDTFDIDKTKHLAIIDTPPNSRWHLI